MSQRKLIFITGASRSGTTLLSFVLRNHDEVFGLKELQYFGSAWDPRDRQRKFTRAQAIEAAASLFACQEFGILAPRVTDEHQRRAAALVDGLGEHGSDPAELFAAAVNDLARAAGKSIPCEQTPRYVFYAGALLDLYPGAQVVHLVRDPRAVMASQKKRWQRRSLARAGVNVPRWQSLRVWVNYHPFTVARLWSRATRAALALAKHPRVTILKFEDLVREPEPTVRRLCSRLGLSFDERMLDVGQINSSHQSSAAGARKGLHADTIDRWREILTSTEIAVTQRYCADLMNRYGYDLEPVPAPSLWDELRCRVSYALHALGVVLVNPRRAYVQARAVMRPRRPPSGPGMAFAPPGCDEVGLQERHRG
ncbi:MAG: sulfotransferase [Steroidobacteraceae bacterium]